jgi:hypothetical protein
VPLIYGDDSSPPRPVSRLTWVALGAEVVLIAYWVFFVWASESDDRPEFLNGDGGYLLFGSLAFSFAFAVATAILAYLGIRRRRALAPDRADRADKAVFAFALLLNPVLVVPVVGRLVSWMA